MTHLTGGEIETFLGGSLPQAGKRRVVAHLLSGCGACRARLAAYGPLLFPKGSNVELPFARPIDRAFDGVVQRAWAKAQSRASEYCAQANKLEELWEASAAARYREPELMEALALQAVHLSNEIDAEQLGAGLLADLQARAWGEYGNALRVGEKLDQAEQALAWAQSLAEDGSRDPLLLARLADLLASLRVDQRRSDEAQALLQEVLSIYTELGEDHLLGRTLISMANLVYYDGDPVQAAALAREGLDLLEPGRDASLEIAAEKNLILFTAESGRHSLAAELLLKSGLRHRAKDDPLTLVRLQWIEGKIAAGLGRLDRASRFLEAVRRDFDDLGRRNDAAHVALDLAGVWLRQGRLAELRSLSEETYARLARVGIGSEAAKALAYLREACARQQPPLSAITSVRDFFARLQYRPGLVFQPA